MAVSSQMSVAMLPGRLLLGSMLRMRNTITDTPCKGKVCAALLREVVGLVGSPAITLQCKLVCFRAPYILTSLVSSGLF